MRTKRRLPEADSLFCRVEETVAHHAMLEGASAVVLALSGGKDSVCLFHLLRELLPSRGVRFFAAHVNHGLRGGEAERDEQFCRELCRAYGVEYAVFFCDVPSYARERSLCAEDAARELRYSALLQFAKEKGALLVTAHTANDQAETVFMRLSRGSGLAGASGIEPVRADGVIRPLLDVTSEEVLAFLANGRFSFVTDSSNSDTRFLRNFYRSEIIPRLEEKNPALVSSLCRFARISREEHAAFLNLAREKLQSLGLFPVTVRVKKAPILALFEKRENRPILHLLFSEMLLSAGGGILCEDAFFRLLDSLRKEGRVGASVEVGGGYCFLIECDSVAVLCERGTFVTECALSLGETVFGTETFRLETCERAAEVPKIHKMHTSVYLSCDKIVGSVRVRNRQTGDTYTVQGKRRFVKDIFSMRAVPQGMRRTYPLVCDDAGILWIPGELCDDRVRAETGERAFCLSLVAGTLYEELLKRRHHE